MAAVGGLLLTLVCIGIVALAVGLVIACWDHHTKTWGPRFARGAVVGFGLSCLLLAAAHPIAQALP